MASDSQTYFGGLYKKKRLYWLSRIFLCFFKGFLLSYSYTSLTQHSATATVFGFFFANEWLLSRYSTIASPHDFSALWFISDFLSFFIFRAFLWKSQLYFALLCHSNIVIHTFFAAIFQSWYDLWPLVAVKLSYDCLLKNETKNDSRNRVLTWYKLWRKVLAMKLYL